MEPVKNEKGEWVIPASRRPDGTWRKERVVREGYVVSQSLLSLYRLSRHTISRCVCFIVLTHSLTLRRIGLFVYLLLFDSHKMRCVLLRQEQVGRKVKAFLACHLLLLQRQLLPQAPRRPQATTTTRLPLPPQQQAVNPDLLLPPPPLPLLVVQQLLLVVPLLLLPHLLMGKR